jgi:hypothetical protein
MYISLFLEREIKKFFIINTIINNKESLNLLLTLYLNNQEEIEIDLSLFNSFPEYEKFP